jgi:hypothetical protein
LILAGESAGNLKRVTIMSARPDSTVVVQAEYFSADDGIPTIAPQFPAVQNAASYAVSSYVLKPAQLYAQTQRGYEETKTSLLDVLA